MQWTGRPGEGRYPRRGSTTAPYRQRAGYGAAYVRPGEYFAGEVPVPYRRRVTPRGIAWAGALLAAECLWLRLVLGFPGLGDSAGMNDRTVAGWLPLFLLACVAAPMVGVALAADRARTDPYAENADRGHPVWIPVLAGGATAVVGVLVVAAVTAGGAHTVAAVAVGCGAAAAVGIGTGAGMLTVYRDELRVPVAWAVLAVWVGLSLRRAFVWAIEPHAVMHVPAAVDAAVPYAPVLIGAGVAGTTLAGGLTGFVQPRGQAPLLAAITGLWLCATALSVIGPGPEALAVAPWRAIAGSLAGAVTGVLALTVRTWWRDHR